LQNTYVGMEAGYGSKGVQGNTFMGWHAGFANETGNNNVYIGSAAGAVCLGSQNVFIGKAAGAGISNNAKNTALGFEAHFTDNFTNSTAIGAGAICDANNKVRIGNDQVQVIEGEVMFSASSDVRLKKDIQSLKHGLDFINLLKPVQYSFKKGKGEKLFTGFIAQEVEASAKELNFDFSAIVVPESEDDMYSLRYAEFVVPLVKAVQELALQNERLKQEIDLLKADLNN